MLLVITAAAAAINYRKHCSKAGEKKIESTVRKGFLYKSTEEFDKIDQGQQPDMTSNNFPKAIEKYFHCSCDHCYIIGPIIQNKCCKEVEIIQKN